MSLRSICRGTAVLFSIATEDLWSPTEDLLFKPCLLFPLYNLWTLHEFAKFRVDFSFQSVMTIYTHLLEDHLNTHLLERDADNFVSDCVMFKATWILIIKNIRFDLEMYTTCTANCIDFQVFVSLFSAVQAVC